MKRYLIGLFLVILTGLLVFAGYKNLRLMRENGRLANEIAEATKRMTLFKNNYEKVKNLESSLFRIKSTLEAQKASIEADLEQLRQEHAVIQEEKRTLTERLRENAQSYEKRLERCSIASMEMEQKYNQAATSAQERQEEIERLKSVNNYITSEIKRMDNTLDRCENNNRKLSEIAEEVLKEYKNKGVWDALMQKEPLINQKALEIEKFLQEYLDRVERAELE